MEPVLKPNEEVQLDFAGTLPDELRKKLCILVAIDKWSKFPTAKVLSNKTTDVSLKIMQCKISNIGVQCKLRCDEAQTFLAKNIQFFC